MLLHGRELQEAGRYEESRRQFEKTLRSAQVASPAMEATALEHVGFAYYSLRRFAEAERAFSHCLQLRDQLYGANNQTDPNHARILTSLASVQFAANRFRQAEQALDLAGIIWRNVPASLRNDHYVMYLNNVAVFKYRERRYADAARYLREVMAVWQGSLAGHDARLIRAKGSLADVLSRLGEHEEADRLSAEALRDFSTKFEHEPLIAAELLGVRSIVLRRSRRGREAAPFERLARDFLRKAEVTSRVDVSLLAR
jgi:tetratricopeptide (TPR) repeat protein